MNAPITWSFKRLHGAPGHPQFIYRWVRGSEQGGGHAIVDDFGNVVFVS